MIGEISPVADQAMAETPDSNSVPYQHDGLAIHEPEAQSGYFGNIACFYGVRACAERARRASKRNTFRRKSRHTSLAPWASLKTVVLTPNAQDAPWRQ
jgi:hypothetical protein